MTLRDEQNRKTNWPRQNMEAYKLGNISFPSNQIWLLNLVLKTICYHSEQLFPRLLLKETILGKTDSIKIFPGLLAITFFLIRPIFPNYLSHKIIYNDIFE